MLILITNVAYMELRELIQIAEQRGEFELAKELAGVVIPLPKETQPCPRNWDEFLDLLAHTAVPDEFMADRTQTKTTRNPF